MCDPFGDAGLQVEEELEPQVFDQRLPMCHPFGVLTVNAKLAFFLLRAMVSNHEQDAPPVQSEDV